MVDVDRIRPQLGKPRITRRTGDLRRTGWGFLVRVRGRWSTRRGTRDRRFGDRGRRWRSGGVDHDGVGGQRTCGEQDDQHATEHRSRHVHASDASHVQSATGRGRFGGRAAIVFQDRQDRAPNGRYTRRDRCKQPRRHARASAPQGVRDRRPVDAGDPHRFDRFRWANTRPGRCGQRLAHDREHLSGNVWPGPGHRQPDLVERGPGPLVLHAPERHLPR